MHETPKQSIYDYTDEIKLSDTPYGPLNFKRMGPSSAESLAERNKSPEQKQAEEAARKAEQQVEKQKYIDLFRNSKRVCYEPILTEETVGLSHYFGEPLIPKGTRWPKICGSNATFVLQLDIETLPEPQKTKLGGTGLLQFFYQTDSYADCDDMDDLGLVRIISKENAFPMAQPEVEDDVFEIPARKSIIDWKAHDDYPHGEEFMTHYGDYPPDEAETDDIDCIQGDKLGGWSFWTQAAGTDTFDENPECDYIFQIDAGCFYDGRKLPANAPGLFASDGTGHILLTKGKKKPKLHFSWACG